MPDEGSGPDPDAHFCTSSLQRGDCIDPRADEVHGPARPSSGVKSQGCWKIEGRCTRLARDDSARFQEYRDSGPTRDRRSWRHYALVLQGELVHFRSFWTAGDVARVTTGATR
jgi:hypothetical protein